MSSRLSTLSRLAALLALALTAAGLGGCIVVDDGTLPGPPDAAEFEDAAPDGGADLSDEPPPFSGYGHAPIFHDPEECPEEAARRAATPVCDPSCDGVSHFYCSERPGDPCCACRGLGGGGGEGGGGGSGGGGGAPGGGDDGPGAPPGDGSPGAGPQGGGGGVPPSPRPPYREVPA